MKLVDTICPHCGSALKIDSSKNNTTCEYCGATLLLDDGVRHIQYDNAEEAGYQFEKGRQRAQDEARQSFPGVNPQSSYQRKPKKKRKTWLWVLGWIFIFPLPLTILLLRKKDMKPILKYSIIAVAWIVYLLIGLSGESESSNKNSTEPAPTATTVESAQTETKNTEESDLPVETTHEETVQRVSSETDMDIIMRTGHPTYYGSVEQSHVVWDDIEKGRIHFGDKNYGNNDNPILSMDSYKKSDLIRSVFIDFTNFKEEVSVSVDEALKISASYMPFDVMDQWYEYRRSELIVPDEDHQEKDSYYVISYGLTDEGSDAYYAKEHEYSGSIDVIIQVHDEVVQSINITFGTPRWMGSLKQNNYLREEWSCDLYDYR